MLFHLMSNYADEISFIREVLFDVNHESPRQVYADWLEERGDSRGEFLRIDFAMHELDPDSEAFEQLRVQRDKIIRGMDPQWVALLGRVPIESCPRRSTGVLCPLEWHALPPFGDDQTERYCDQCGRSVTYCFSIDQARERSAKGECVAIDRSVLRAEDDLSATTFPMGMFMGFVEIHDD